MNLKYIRQLVFGQDIFISYRWTDTSRNYALQLAKELEERQLDCFIDHNHIQGGDSITWSIQRAIKRSRMFILIVHRDILASTSQWIPQEVQLAQKGRRTIIPLNIGNMIDEFDLASEAWRPLYDRDRIEETLESYESAVPSPGVLTEIDGAFTARRNKSKATRALFVAAVVVLISTLGPAGWAVNFNQRVKVQTQQLQAEAELARGDVVIARGDLQKAQQDLVPLRDELSTKNSELETTKTTLGAAKKDLDGARQDLDGAKSDLASKQGQLEGVQTTLKDKQAELAKATSDLITFRGIEPPRVIPYQPDFLGGVTAPLPTITQAAVRGDTLDGRIFDYTHYSLVMDERRALPLYTACNIDRTTLRNIRRETDNWMLDSRLDRDLQRGGGIYSRNDFDRGHLVRRGEVAWGAEDEARAAAVATFFYSNSTPQYSKFNQRLWFKLEDYYLRKLHPDSPRLTVFTGPVSQPTDIDYRGSRIPQAYWKIIALADHTNDRNIFVYAFLMKQYEIDGTGKFAPVASEVFDARRFQISVAHLESLLPLDFGPLRQFDRFGKG